MFVCVVFALPRVASADVPPAALAAPVSVLDRELKLELGPLRLGDAQPAASSGVSGAASTASDVLLVATMLQAAAVDALLVPMVQGEPELALHASLAHSLALGLTLGVGGIFESTGAGPYNLQTGVAFTSAGFSCAMHLSRRIHGEPAADFAACGASLAMATASGLLGTIGGQQDFGDVLVGGALGLLVGYLTPLAIVPERQQVDARALLDVEADEEPLPEGRGGTSWSVVPMVSTPSSRLAPEYEERLRGGQVGAQIGPGTSGAGPGAGIGSAIGVSAKITF